MKLQLKTLVVEDTQTELEILELLLKEHGKDIIDLNSIKIAHSYEEAVVLIHTSKGFDLSIMDCKLGTKNVYDLVREVKREKLGIIAFTSIDRTANTEEILKLNPDIYFFKPHEPDVVKKFIIELEEFAKLEELKRRTHFLIKEKGDFIKIPNEQIYYFAGFRRYTIIIYKDGNGMFKKYTVTLNLGEVYESLNPTVFYRCHDSYIVNINHIRKCNNEMIIIFDELEFDPVNVERDKMVDALHTITFNKEFKKVLNSLNLL